MRHTLRIGLGALAVILAFGLTYLAFAPEPFGERVDIAGPGVAVSEASSGSNDGEPQADGWSTDATTAPAADQRTLGVGEEPGDQGSAAAAELEDAPDYTPQANVNHYQRGQQLFWQRDYAAAAVELERAIRQRPGNYYPHYLLGLTYQRLGDSQRAEREYVAAREINGEQPEALINLARLYLELDNATEALELATHATEVTPEYAPAWNVRGRAQLALGRRDSAVTAFTEATRLNPDNAYAWNNLGYTHILGGDYQAALKPLEKATTLRTKVAYMHNNLGVVLEQLGRLEQAHAAFVRAAELVPEHAAAAASAQRLAALLPERRAIAEAAEPAGESGNDPADVVGPPAPVDDATPVVEAVPVAAVTSGSMD